MNQLEHLESRIKCLSKQVMGERRITYKWPTRDNACSSRQEISPDDILPNWVYDPLSSKLKYANSPLERYSFHYFDFQVHIFAEGLSATPTCQ